MPTVDLPCIDVMPRDGLSFGMPDPGDFGEPLGGWPVGSLELSIGALSSGRDALASPYTGLVYATWPDYDVHDSTLINMGVEFEPSSGETPDLDYWRLDRSYDVTFAADSRVRGPVTLVAHLSVTGGGSQKFWLTYTESDEAVAWVSLTPTIETGGASEQIREFTVTVPDLTGSDVAEGYAAVFAQTGSGSTCRVTYLALRVAADSVVRQHPRDDGLGHSSAPRLYPPPKAQRVVGGYQ